MIKTIFDIEHIQLESGQPCHHRGCLSHRTHPCEVCGRVGGAGETWVVKEEFKKRFIMKIKKKIELTEKDLLAVVAEKFGIIEDGATISIYHDDGDGGRFAPKNTITVEGVEKGKNFEK